MARLGSSPEESAHELARHPHSGIPRNEQAGNAFPSHPLPRGLDASSRSDRDDQGGLGRLQDRLHLRTVEAGWVANQNQNAIAVLDKISRAINTVKTIVAGAMRNAQPFGDLGYRPPDSGMPTSDEIHGKLL